MRRTRCSLLVATALTTSACANQGLDPAVVGQVLGATGAPAAASSASLSQGDIAAGLKEALAQGTRLAIGQLGRNDGFWADDKVRIPLPAQLRKVEPTLRQMGQGNRLDQFHQTMNKAAEQAIPEVAELFAVAIQQMTLDDARMLLQGNDHAATDYFRRTTGDALFARIRPIVAKATSQVGVTQQYKQLGSSLGPLLQLGGVQMDDLDSYVTQMALNGLFLKIADEEARIRDNPAARGTALLQKVFGSR